MRHFVFVESNTTGTGRLAVERLLERGDRVTFLTRSPGKYPFLAAPVPGLATVEMETNDADAVVDRVAALRAREPVDALLTFSEFYVEVTARAARRLGFRYLSPEAARTCRHKPSCRRALRAAGLPVPDFWEVSSPAEAARLAGRIPYPAVVKPPADSSSTGVLRVENPGQLMAQFRAVSGWSENVRGQKLDGRVLVESFLDGPELSVETFTLPDGRVEVVAVVDKHLTAPPYFAEVGHDLPGGGDPATRQALVEATRRALAAVGYDFGPAHTELKWTPAGAMAVEINPRLAGGMIPELVDYALGIDLLGAWLSLLVGEAVELAPRRSDYASIRFLVGEREGRLLRVEGVEAAEAVPGVRQVLVSKGPGTRVQAPRDAYDRLGHVIAAGPDRAAAAAAADRGLAALRLVLEEELASAAGGEA